MSTKPRTPEEIRTMFNRMRARIRAENECIRNGGQGPDANRVMMDDAWIFSILWCLGGCINPHHPPECAGMRAECLEEQ